MLYFVGSWTCTILHGHASATTLKPFSAQNVVSADGHWIVGRSKYGEQWISWDSTKQKWVFMWMASSGRYDVAYSSGWTGNTMLVTDVLDSGDRLPDTNTYTKISERLYRTNIPGPSTADDRGAQCERTGDG